MKTVRVNWNIEAIAECPYCETSNDFMDIDEWWVYCGVGESKDKFFAPIKITCEGCKKEFEINGSDY